MFCSKARFVTVFLILTLLAPLTSNIAAAQSVSFSTRGPFPVGSSPAAGAAGNFNGGGKLDVVTRNDADKAVITSPSPGSTLPGPTVTFTWSQETGATSYQLWLGHTAGTYDITYVGTTGLTATMTNLPTDGSAIYATLYGYAGGQWSVQDTAVYTAGTIVNAQITSPPKFTMLPSDTVTFTWSAEAGATSYQLWIGSAPGQYDLGVGGTSNTTIIMGNLPTDGSPIYVTLYGYAGGWWSVQDTATYNALTRVNAQITSPPKFSTLESDLVTFTWSAEAGATSYQLWIGSTPDQYDLGVGGTSDTTVTMGNLPTDGSMLYVTLWGYNGTTWAVQDTAQYTAYGGPAPSRPSKQTKPALTLRLKR